MNIPKEVVDSWMAGEDVHGLEFGLNDSVDITGGRWRGRAGSIITPVALRPEPSYLVELGDTGEGVEVPQSQLEIVESNRP